MSTFDKKKNKLISKLRNKEYRDAFVSEHISTGIPFQIKALREQRGWTQKELGKISGKHQEIISQLENPDYGNFSLATLKRIASAFDIGLVVRFVAFSELVRWDLNLSSDSLKVPSFNDDLFSTINDIHENDHTFDRVGVVLHSAKSSGNNVTVLEDYKENKAKINFEMSGAVGRPPDIDQLAAS